MPDKKETLFDKLAAEIQSDQAKQGQRKSDKERQELLYKHDLVLGAQICGEMFDKLGIQQALESVNERFLQGGGTLNKAGGIHSTAGVDADGVSYSYHCSYSNLILSWPYYGYDWTTWSYKNGLRRLGVVIYRAQHEGSFRDWDTFYFRVAYAPFNVQLDQVTLSTNDNSRRGSNVGTMYLPEHGWEELVVRANDWMYERIYEIGAPDNLSNGSVFQIPEKLKKPEPPKHKWPWQR